MKPKNCLIFVIFATATLNTQPSVQQDFSQPASATAKAINDFFSTITTLLQNAQKPSAVAQFLNNSMGAILTLIAKTSDKKGAELDLFMDDIKKDCKELLNEHIATVTNDVKNEELRRPSNHEKDPQATEATLCNVASVVAGVVSIAQNPHNKETVKQSIGAIICGIVGIALNASHRSIAHPLLHCYTALATAQNLA
jgi:hypothetical protein